MHPLETEVDKTLKNLQIDLKTAKHTTGTGILYQFEFGETSSYVALPTFVPSVHDNLVRAEFTVGVVGGKDVGRLLHAITLDFDMHRHHPIRAVSRTKDDREHKILLQFVCALDLMRSGFVAMTILFGLELAQFYRDEFLSQSRSA